jgi:Arc/MetJ family transcription regulator
VNRHGSPTGRAIQGAAYDRQWIGGQDTARRAFGRWKHCNAHHSMLISVPEADMRTTIVLDDDLLQAAQDYTGLTEKSALVREALKALIEREAARRLIKLGGSQPDFKAGPRRRPPLA